MAFVANGIVNPISQSREALKTEECRFCPAEGSVKAIATSVIVSIGNSGKGGKFKKELSS